MVQGKRFCGGLEKKLREWDEGLKVLGAGLEPIQEGRRGFFSVMESSHRADDEYFLMIHAERCRSKEEFILKARGWQETWNFYRPSLG